MLNKNYTKFLTLNISKYEIVFQDFTEKTIIGKEEMYKYIWITRITIIYNLINTRNSKSWCKNISLHLFICWTQKSDGALKTDGYAKV